MRLLFILLTSSVCLGQNNPTPGFETGVPSSWLGRYEGQMEIYSPKGLQQTVGVQLDIQIMDRENYWAYNMSYLSPQGETLSTKAYHIVYDETNNKLWMDEGDSLLIEMTHMGNCLFDHYELSGMFFNSSLCKQDANLIFEISGGQSKASYTSPFIEEAEGVVESMRVDFLQKALLKPVI
ncbi:MAG: hypothetical protein RLZZ65_1893 [Bacteroidota bacterium]|jgi:hypothetical protein